MSERPWLANYPPDVPPTLAPFPKKSVYALLEESASRFPEHPAVVFPVAPMAKRLTYRQLAAESGQLSRALASLGFEKAIESLSSFPIARNT
jgi:long-chain acyl-CoA synthetase